MNRLLIDGYNLLNSRSFPVPERLDLEGKREHMIRILKSYAGRSNVRISLVFDNSQKPSRQVSGERHIKIIFSAPGQEADDVIRQMIRKEKSPASLTVVSSDLAIRFSAKDHGISSLSSEEFCAIMQAGGGMAGHPAPHPASSDPADSPASPSAKYDSNIGEDEVQFWKEIFEKGRRDE